LHEWQSISYPVDRSGGTVARQSSCPQRLGLLSSGNPDLAEAVSAPESHEMRPGQREKGVLPESSTPFPSETAFYF